MENNELAVRVPSAEEMRAAIGSRIADIDEEVKGLVITDDASLSVASELRELKVKEALKVIDQARKQFKAPFAAQAEAVDDFFRPFIGALEEIKQGVGMKMIAYNNEQKSKREQVERDLQKKAIDDAKKAGQTTVVLPTVAAPEKTIATTAARTTFIKRWAYQVMDETLVPREYLAVDEVKIGKAVRRADQPVRNIPGVRIYEEDGLTGGKNSGF